MTRAELNAICASLPGATLEDPWGGGHDAWKVGGKMFASIGTHTPGIAVKTDSTDQAAHLIDLGIAQKAPYFHASWVLLPWQTPEDEATHRITESYRLIRSKLTKKIQATLDPL